VVVNSTNIDCSFIGNVLGTTNWQTNYIYSTVNYPTNYGVIKTVFGNMGFFENNTNSFFGDTQTVRSLNINGNWDSANLGVTWNSGGVQTLPSSMYLTAMPSWWNSWGTTPWPPIGSDLTPLVCPLPAQLEYESSMGGPTVPTSTTPTTYPFLIGILTIKEF
jgi:hypothetical protein